MKSKESQTDPFMALVRAIVIGDTTIASRMLASSPNLARECAAHGATRKSAGTHFFDGILHYMYAGDTALHMAAAAYRVHIAEDLISRGAGVRSKNRRGAEPLHYAADGVPGSKGWNPLEQAATIALLIKAGADPNTVDKSGVTPLHRAVRTRCATAVEALLTGGADAGARSKSGSTPSQLAVRNTGRGGSGSPEARAQQEAILRLLKAANAT